MINNLYLHKLLIKKLKNYSDIMGTYLCRSMHMMHKIAYLISAN